MLNPSYAFIKVFYPSKFHILEFNLKQVFLHYKDIFLLFVHFIIKIITTNYKNNLSLIDKNLLLFYNILI